MSAPTPQSPLKTDQFPRSSVLPSQSPLFWVQQKDRYLRQLLIRDIEEQTGRRLIVYFGNRYVADSGIVVADIARMAEILSDVGGEHVDILLETSGGETDTTEGLISLIKSSLPSFRVIVANAAKSNGTLLVSVRDHVVENASSRLTGLHKPKDLIAARIERPGSVRAGVHGRDTKCVQ